MRSQRNGKYRLLRKSTVRLARRNGKNLPMVLLRGAWLADVGFDVGTQLTVIVQDGKLTIVMSEEWHGTHTTPKVAAVVDRTTSGD